ncbi:winged helix-turn-helix transcriptional regulator [Cohnella sp. JJ-181]|uniref:winged helix-turn-helix transcriptional regulator n=1 Tax=Cohnella rhizoplanae TaxID=2974897 RepID=UPI0022FF801D|nr:helix-turn-helix domain-containing protein [Cohnella sp. JJ-181]CAI6085644.1 putative HTH-type transcriptional regulator YtcD [Cohnella sp. JJ-181]
MIHFRDKAYRCASEIAMELVSGKWKILILSHLADQTFRFGELLKLMPGATHKMLTEQLRDLERDGLIARSVYPVVPPKVEYDLTDRGMRLVPLLKQLCDFGADYIDSFPAEASSMEDKRA